MRAALLLALYLGDEILSQALPFSSGLFAVALALLYFDDIRTTRSLRLRVVITMAALLLCGTAGALASGTPVTAFSAATIVLMTSVWLCGAAAPRHATRSFGPGHGLVGVALSTFFLVLASAGFDLFSVVTGRPSARGAGLYMEPSHLALYVMPLWLIAFERRRWRPALWVALAIVAATSFSLTLAAGLLIAYALWTAASGRLSRVAGNALRAGAVVAVVAVLPISVDGVSLPDYIGARLTGLSASDADDPLNLSSLVVLQGLEIAWLSSVDSAGLGVGLGNLGTGMPIVEQSAYRAILVAANSGNIDLNLRDGGILASKLVGELGVLSLVLLLALGRWLRTAMRIEPVAVRRYHLAWAAVLLTLLLVRALPYFAAPTCMAVLSVASLLTVHRRRMPRARPSTSESSLSCG